MAEMTETGSKMVMLAMILGMLPAVLTADGDIGGR